MFISSKPLVGFAFLSLISGINAINCDYGVTPPESGVSSSTSSVTVFLLWSTTKIVQAVIYSGDCWGGQSRTINSDANCVALSGTWMYVRNSIYAVFSLPNVNYRSHNVGSIALAEDRFDSQTNCYIYRQAAFYPFTYAKKSAYLTVYSDANCGNQNLLVRFIGYDSSRPDLFEGDDIGGQVESIRCEDLPRS